jgi:hypothetical protein
MDITAYDCPISRLAHNDLLASRTENTPLRSLVTDLMHKAKDGVDAESAIVNRVLAVLGVSPWHSIHRGAPMLVLASNGAALF